MQDAGLQELLSRDASANEAFKREVERMVREAARKDELDAHAKKVERAAPAGMKDRRNATSTFDSSDLSTRTPLVP